MRLTAFHLQLLSEVGRAGSLAGAARALGLTPPAVTQAVARMESLVGATLVERGARGARLTALGNLLAAEGALVNDAVDRASERASTFLGVHAQRLRVGALSSTIRPVVADALAHVRLRHSGAALSVVEVGSDEGAELVRAGDIDLAVVATYGATPQAWTDLGVQELAVDPLLVVVPDDHDLAATTRPVTVDRLAGAMWAGGSPGRPHRIQQDLVLSDGSTPPKVPFETESYEVALALVAAGVALALVPASACLRLDGAVALRVQGDPARALHAVTRPPSDHLPLLAPMVDALARTARERVAPRAVRRQRVR